MTPEKIDRLHLMEINFFFFFAWQKTLLKRMKKEATHWENTVTKHLCIKEFVSKIYKEPLKFKKQKKTIF